MTASDLDRLRIRLTQMKKIRHIVKTTYISTNLSVFLRKKTKTFRHQKFEHTEAATWAHSSSETLSLCALTMDNHNFLTVDGSEPSFTFGRTTRDKFLIISGRRNTWTRTPWWRGISYRKIGRHNNLSIFRNSKFLRLDRSRHRSGRDSSG